MEQSSVPESHAERDNSSPIGYNIDEGSKPHEKRKRKLKKRKERFKPVVDTHPNDSSSNSESERVMKNLTKQIEKLEILQRAIEKPDKSVCLSKDLDTCHPVRSTILVDEAKRHYEVVSRGVQTDWSWLNDKRSKSNYVIDQSDMNEILDSLRFGLYGGFGAPKAMAKKQTIPRDKTDNLKEENNAGLVSRSTVHGTPGKSTVHGTPGKLLSKRRTVKKKTPPRELSSRRAYDEHQSVSDEDMAVVLDDGCHGNRSEEVFEANIRDMSTPASVGAPEIVKYHREKPSKNPKLEKKKSSETATNYSPVPPAEEGLFNGLCQFCRKEILPLPTEEEISISQDHQLFCCPEYHHFIKLHIESQQQENAFDEDMMIDVSPHAPYGSKIIQKVNRDAMAEKIRERELERQRAAVQQANLFSFSRQMKTIQFSLASTKCFADGWAALPKTPPPQQLSITSEIFKVEINSNLLQKAATMNEKFYDNEARVTPSQLFCSYPSGNVAVSIISVHSGQYSYIVHSNEYDDDLDGCGLLALFEPNGTGICYFQKKRKLKLFLNAQGGIELDKSGGKRKRWQWYFTKGQLTTPPFQPLCFPLNKNISVRLLDQDNIALIFTANKRCIRFNVGANLKALKLEGLGRFAPDDSEVYLYKKRKEISNVLADFYDALRLPKSTRFIKPCPVRSKKNKGDETFFPPIDADVIVN